MTSQASTEIILTSSPDGPITAYDPFSGTILARFSGSRSPRGGLTTVAGTSSIAVSHVSSDTCAGSIHLYNWWSSTPFNKIPLSEPVAPIATASDGCVLFAGGLSGNIHTIKIPSGNIIRSFSAHSKAVSCLEINDDGSLLISGGEDGLIIVSTIFKLVAQSSFDENLSNLHMYRLSAHSGTVTSVKSSMNKILSCSLDGTCKLWGICDGTLLLKLTFPCPIWDVALDKLATFFYAAGSDGHVYTGSLSNKKNPVALGEENQGAVVSVSIINEGRSVISASEEGHIQVRDIERGTVASILGDQEMVAISDLVVVRKEKKVRGFNEHGFRNCGRSSIREQCRNVGDRELEEVLSDVGKERSKAIEMLESAIGMHERLLHLILKEAKGECGSSKD